MFLLPFRTNIWPRRTPYANYALIIINALIFLITYHVHRVPGTYNIEILRSWAVRFQLVPSEKIWWQYFTYAFLHGDWFHILGNMFFLYLFGNNVNDKLGHLGYILLYTAAGIFAAFGHVMINPTSNIPMLGASGAIAGVTGAYMVFYPQTLITVVYWFFFIGTIEIPALYFILFKLIIIDNILARMPNSVAYDAHLAGYAFGIGCCIGLLSMGVIKVSNFDLWSMIKLWNRRRVYRDAVTGGYDPYNPSSGMKSVRSREVKLNHTEQRRNARIQELRAKISNDIANRNLPGTTDTYLELMSLDNNQILPKQQLLDIANQIASENRYAEAAQAYEQFLANYSNYEYSEQVQLMLGLLYSRYLQNNQMAIKHLETAADRLTDPGQLKMCKEELARLGK